MGILKYGQALHKCKKGKRKCVCIRCIFQDSETGIENVGWMKLIAKRDVARAGDHGKVCI